MFRRNMGSKERVERMVFGALLICTGVVAMHSSALGIAVAAVGGVSLITGIFSYCPACAVAGREPTASNERLVYAVDGGFLTSSLLDYALPTALMIPKLEILHQVTPSPVTPLGAKGVAEGNSMSAPVCIANAVADALGVAEVSLPLTPKRLVEMVRRQSQ